MEELNDSMGRDTKERKGNAILRNSSNSHAQTGSHLYISMSTPNRHCIDELQTANAIFDFQAQ
jgi:hypothetical protein